MADESTHIAVARMAEATLRLAPDGAHSPRIIYGLGEHERTDRYTNDYGEGIEVLVAWISFGALMLEWGCYCHADLNEQPGDRTHLVTHSFDAREDDPCSYERMVVPAGAMTRLMLFLLQQPDPYPAEGVEVPPIEDWEAV